MSVEDAAPLMSMWEIAQLAQVKRPVVTTWRRRHRDFPQPAAELASQQLLFDGEQVVAWLTARGLGNTDPVELQVNLALYTIIAGAAGQDPSCILEALGALLCLRFLTDRRLSAATAIIQAERMDAEDELLLTELRGYQESGRDLVGLVGLAESLIEAAYSESGAYEWLLAARDRFRLAHLVEDTPTPDLLNLLVELADLPAWFERPGRITLADPRAGAGDLLTALVRAADHPQRTIVLAAEPDERMARSLRRRLVLAGVDDLGLDVRAGGDLEERIADPDLIITQLRYQGREERSVIAALEAVEAVADLLRPGAIALVLGPADALVDSLSGVRESRLRSELLRSNVIEAVVALPGGMLPFRPGYRMGLWILHREPVPAARGNVLLADLSAEQLTEPVRERLTEDVLLWRAEGNRGLQGHDARYGRAVPIAQLDRSFRGALLPPGPSASQLLGREVRDRPALLVETEAALARAAQQAQQHQGEHGPYYSRLIRRTAGKPRRINLGTLIADGRVDKLPGHRIVKEQLKLDGHYPVLGPEEIAGRGAVGARRLDRLLLAYQYGHVSLTEPGDLLFTQTPEFILYVDEEGLSIAAFPVRILRVNRQARRPLTPRVLAALLGAARGTGRSPGAVRAARQIEDFELPDLDPKETMRFDALLAEIEQRDRLLRAQADALASARRLATAGLADGTLTFDMH
jgi:hypothetical protein